MKRSSHWVAALAALAGCGPALGGFTVVNGFENWIAAAGPSTKLDFVFSEPQVLSNQYEMFGVTFPGGGSVVYPSGTFQQDGWGVKNQFFSFVDIPMKFAKPVYSIGAWFPGDIFAKLYWQGELVYSSPSLKTFLQSPSFGGIVSTQPFDEVVFYSPTSQAAIDDIYFSTIPTPGAAPLLFAALVAGGRRRRK